MKRYMTSFRLGVKNGELRLLCDIERCPQPEMVIVYEKTDWIIHRVRQHMKRLHAIDAVGVEVASLRQVVNVTWYEKEEPNVTAHHRQKNRRRPVGDDGDEG